MVYKSLFKKGVIVKLTDVDLLCSSSENRIWDGDYRFASDVYKPLQLFNIRFMMQSIVC